MDDPNARVIEEFRANGGKVGGYFQGMDLLLLHHKGAKTGTVRVNPVAYQARPEGWAVFASKGGAPTNPDWYHNLVSHPEIEVEVGTETVPVRARVAGPEERETIYSKQAVAVQGFADYQAKTTRVIPVVVLERR